MKQRSAVTHFIQRLFHSCCVCRLLKVQTLLNVFILQHSESSFILTVCFYQKTQPLADIYTLVWKKLYILLNYAEILLKAFFWSLLET